VTLSMTVSGADQRIRFDWQAAATAWASDVSRLGVAALKVAAPVAKRPSGTEKPGRLRDSITFRVQDSTGVMSVLLYTTVPYAGFVTGGTRPHPITVRNARALHWTDDDGDHFAVTVNHPGTKANKFPERALSPLRPALAGLFTRAVQEATIRD
jgi:hypothetical protein